MEDEILHALLRVTLAISAAIVVVLLLRQPIRTWLGARNAYALWVIIPLSAIAVLLPARRIIASLPDNTPSSIMVPPVTPAPSSMVEVPEAATPAVSLLNTSTIEWEPIFFFIWLSGLVSALLLLMWRQQRFLKRLGNLERSSCDGVEVYKSNTLDIGPALVGALDPRLVIPADFNQRYTTRERQLVLAHEHVHLSRRDVQINGLVAVFGCLFWFNPLFAFAVVRMREDQEMACDAAVLAQQAGARGDYARALLKTQLSSEVIPIGCAWPSAGSHPLKTRMTALTVTKQNRLRERIGALVIASIALTGGAVAWAMQPPVVSVALNEASPEITAPEGPLSAPSPSPQENVSETSSSYIDRLASSGLKDLTVDQLIALKVHDVDIAEINSAKQLGFDPTPQNLIAMSVANVTPEFVVEVREQGWRNVSVQELVSMRHMGVNPGDAKKFEALGIKQMSIQQLTRFAAMNVTVEYIRALQAKGITESEPNAYARAAAMGITPEFIDEARRHGFDDLTLDKLARLKSIDIF